MIRNEQESEGALVHLEVELTIEILDTLGVESGELQYT